jgi:hypothetical protein
MTVVVLVQLRDQIASYEVAMETAIVCVTACVQAPHAQMAGLGYAYYTFIDGWTEGSGEEEIFVNEKGRFEFRSSTQVTNKNNPDT